MKKTFFSFVVYFTWFLILTLAAFAETFAAMSVESETKFFVKIMSLNSAITTQKVGVIFDPANSASTTYKKKIISSLSGYGIESVSVPLTAIEQAKGHGVNVFYLSKSLSALENIANTARKNKIVTFSSEYNNVENGFASVSVGISNNGKNKIIINMKNLKKEGHMFSSQLLKLATIIN